MISHVYMVTPVRRVIPTQNTPNIIKSKKIITGHKIVIHNRKRIVLISNLTKQTTTGHSSLSQQS
jgi:hypothetical protein